MSIEKHPYTAHDPVHPQWEWPKWEQPIPRKEGTAPKWELERLASSPIWHNTKTPNLIGAAGAIRESGPRRMSPSKQQRRPPPRMLHLPPAGAAWAGPGRGRPPPGPRRPRTVFCRAPGGRGTARAGGSGSGCGDAPGWRPREQDKPHPHAGASTADNPTHNHPAQGTLRSSGNPGLYCDPKN